MVEYIGTDFGKNIREKKMSKTNKATLSSREHSITINILYSIINIKNFLPAQYSLNALQLIESSNSSNNNQTHTHMKIVSFGYNYYPCFIDEVIQKQKS